MMVYINLMYANVMLMVICIYVLKWFLQCHANSIV